MHFTVSNIWETVLTSHKPTATGIDVAWLLMTATNQDTFMRIKKKKDKILSGRKITAIF
jgi:hypothetical protein